MKKIGIVFAISRDAGEHCKKLVRQYSPGQVEIVTHECPAEKYKAATYDLNQIANLVLESIQNLQQNGAGIIIIAANSVHRAFSIINERVKKASPGITLISIIDASMEEIRNKQFKTVGIFGSNSTISSNIYQDKLHDEKVAHVALSPEDQSFIHALISSGVSPNNIEEDTKQKVIKIAEKLKDAGCDAIILACTELALIFNSNNLGIPVVDTNLALARAATKAATTNNDLGNGSSNNSSDFQSYIRARL